jgi:hypothetical protein
MPVSFHAHHLLGVGVIDVSQRRILVSMQESDNLIWVLVLLSNPKHYNEQGAVFVEHLF